MTNLGLLNTSSIGELVQWRATVSPDKIAYIYIADGEHEEYRVTYQELDLKAKIIAFNLHKYKLSGERAILLYPQGLDFIYAFLGCIYAGVIAVPAYPPRKNRNLERIKSIITDSGAKAALTIGASYKDIQRNFSEEADLKEFAWIVTDSLEHTETPFKPLAVHKDSVAFLQYTSGSTGVPKGVMVSHGNILENSQSIRECFEHNEESVSVTWLPSFHDMGLIDGVLQPLYSGFTGVLMSPASFLEKPIRWLNAISRFKATHSGGPNFAYDLCAKKITSDKMEGLDLSRWKVAYNGAEPIRNESMERFSEVFKAAGFRYNYFYPCYGLAEATLMVSASTKLVGPKIFDPKKQQTEACEHTYLQLDERAGVIGCGHIWRDTQVEIVNSETLTVCLPGETGEIWVSGNSVTMGYWNKPKETEEAYAARIVGSGKGPYMRTGDLGFMIDGELYVTGRLKDLIIIRGQNYYPQDIEVTVEKSHHSLRQNSGAAFSVLKGSEELLGVVYEVERTAVQNINIDEIVDKIVKNVLEQHGIQLHYLVLIRTGTIAKTSSGKIQRRVCRNKFMENDLSVIAEWRYKENNERAAVERQEVFGSSVLTEIERTLIKIVAQSLNVPDRLIDTDESVERYGADSLKAVQLSEQLGEVFQLKLESTILYNYPTIRRLAGYIAEKKSGSLKSEQSTGFATEDIAIIGAACRFPGASNLGEFWELLRNGRSAILQVPISRWDSNDLNDLTAEEKIAVQYAGLLEGIDMFDPAFFGISGKEAVYIDPQQRLFLEVSWEAIEHAGIPPTGIYGKEIGIFAGTSNNDYFKLQLQSSDIGPYSGTGNSSSIVANRLSYLWDLKGPSVAIDTACSSSLMALHLACQSLRNNECKVALAGGVNLILTPDLSVIFAKAGMLSRSGNLRAFDSGADGYVRGEGCGVVVLKLLSHALKDGDRVLAVVKGTGVNQDGKTNGLTAPNGPSQVNVIRKALNDAKLASSDISYLEAHGTGTILGDPIEFNSLKEALSGFSSNDPACYIGSVKSNIGHLEAASGIAGIIKTVLALQHKVIPPIANFESINPNITLDDTRLRIASEALAWSQVSGKRRAGVSSFGFGGTNVHVILEEAEPVSPQQPLAGMSYLFTLSAKTGEALHALCEKSVTYLHEASETDFESICYTSNSVKTGFNYKVAFVADSKDSLIQDITNTLNNYSAGDILKGRVHTTRPLNSIVIFKGEGAEYLEIGETLYRLSPVFRNIVDEYNSTLKSILGKSFLEIIEYFRAKQDEFRVSEYNRAFALTVELSVAGLWKSLGIQPTLVAALGWGKLAADCFSELLTYDKAIQYLLKAEALLKEHSGNIFAVFKLPDPKIIPIIYPVTQLSSCIHLVAVSSKDQESFAHLLKARSIHFKMLNSYPVADEVCRKQIMLVCSGHISGSADLYIYEKGKAPRICTEFGEMEVIFRNYNIDFIIEFGLPSFTSLVRKKKIQFRNRKLNFYSVNNSPYHNILEGAGMYFESGGTIQWDNLYLDRHPLKTAIPTHPFLKKRYWIKEKQISSITNFLPVTTMSDNNISTDRNLGEKQYMSLIIKQLTTIVSEILNVPEDGIESALPFVEMGADSIVLIDLVKKLEVEFELKIAIHQLFEELSSIEKLGSFLTKKYLSAAKAEVKPLVTADKNLHTSRLSITEILRDQKSNESGLLEIRSTAGAHTHPSADTDFMQNLFQEQLDIMSRQLKLLESGQFSKAGGAVKKAEASVSNAAAIVKAKAKPAPSIFPARETSRTSVGFSSSQEKYIKDFIEKYNYSKRKSKALTQQYRPVLADNRASAGFRFSIKEILYPIISDSSKGSRMSDIDGNNYVDIAMGFGVNLFGHNPTFIQQAMLEQVEKGVQLGPQTQLAGEVAELISRFTGMERVSFHNSGTEAIMTAARLARTVTGRNKIAVFSKSYHGHFDGTLGVADPETTNTKTVAMAPGVMQGMVDDLLVLDYGSAEALETIKAFAGELAAVIVEPVQSRNPDLQPKEFLHQLRELTAQNDITLIFDEIISGFRIGKGGAQEWFGVKADMATYGKIIGGGLPIGIIAGASKYMDSLDGGMWNYGDDSYPKAETTFFAGTFCKHPLTLSATKAVLQEIERRGDAMYKKLNSKTAYLVNTLNTFFRENEVSVHVGSFGSLFYFSFTGNIDLFFYHLLHKGIYIWEGRTCFLSTEHSDEDVEFIIKTVKESVSEMQEAGWFGRKTGPVKSIPVFVDAYPLSFEQQKMYSLAVTHSEASAAFHECQIMSLRGTPDIQALKEAVEMSVNRHSALRTVRIEADKQIANKYIELDIPYIDLSTDAQNRSQGIVEWAKSEVYKPFDFSKGPFVRFFLIKEKEQTYYLISVFHHIISDGWSIELVWKEISQIYNSKSNSSLVTLEAPASFSEFISWENKGFTTAPEPEVYNFWMKQISKTPDPLKFPLAGIGIGKSYSGASARFIMDEERRKAINAFARKEQSTPFMILIAAYAVLLNKFTQAERLVIGVPLAGQIGINKPYLVGQCVRLLPLYVDVQTAMTVKEIICSVKENLMGLYKYQNISLDKIFIDRNDLTIPDITTVFDMSRVKNQIEFSGIESKLLETPVLYSKYDLSVSILEFEKELSVDFLYKQDLFTANTIQYWMDCYKEIINSIVKEGDRRVSDISILPKEHIQIRKQLWDNF